MEFRPKFAALEQECAKDLNGGVAMFDLIIQAGKSGTPEGAHRRKTVE